MSSRYYYYYKYRSTIKKMKKKNLRAFFVLYNIKYYNGVCGIQCFGPNPIDRQSVTTETDSFFRSLTNDVNKSHRRRVRRRLRSRFLRDTKLSSPSQIIIIIIITAATLIFHYSSTRVPTFKSRFPWSLFFSSVTFFSRNTHRIVFDAQMSPPLLLKIIILYDCEIDNHHTRV